MRRLAATVLVLAACSRTTHDVPSAPPSSASNDAEPSGSARSSGEPIADAAPPPELPDVRTEWCLGEWRGLDESTCHLVPKGAGRSLLIYLPGIVPPAPRSPQKENVERIVAAAATRARVVALLPRGVRGIGPADAKDWWAWPTSPADYTAHAPKLVAAFLAARAKLETVLGPFERTYLAGSSSGAYFLSALALSGAVAMDGYAAASGGAPGLAGIAPHAKRAPFYVGYGSGDPTNGGPKALGKYLASHDWPVRVAEHPGGHGAREVYLDEAFAFWASGR